MSKVQRKCQKIKCSGTFYVVYLPLTCFPSFEVNQLGVTSNLSTFYWLLSLWKESLSVSTARAEGMEDTAMPFTWLDINKGLSSKNKTWRFKGLLVKAYQKLYFSITNSFSIDRWRAEVCIKPWIVDLYPPQQRKKYFQMPALELCAVIHAIQGDAAVGTEWCKAKHKAIIFGL